MARQSLSIAYFDWPLEKAPAQMVIALYLALPVSVAAGCPVCNLLQLSQACRYSCAFITAILLTDCQTWPECSCICGSIRREVIIAEVMVSVSVHVSLSVICLYVCAGHRTPKGLSAVGWRVGIYWVQDQKFYLGKVLHYDKDEETPYKYNIKYDDGKQLPYYATLLRPPEPCGLSTCDRLTHVACCLPRIPYCMWPWSPMVAYSCSFSCMHLCSSFASSRSEDALQATRCALACKAGSFRVVDSMPLCMFSGEGYDVGLCNEPV